MRMTSIKIMAGAIEEQRKQYLTDHPEILEDYRKGNFSTKGYHRLQQTLKFSSKRQVQEFLQKIINEQGGGIARCRRYRRPWAGSNRNLRRLKHNRCAHGGHKELYYTVE